MSNRMSNKLLKKELPCFDKLRINGRFLQSSQTIRIFLLALLTIISLARPATAQESPASTSQAAATSEEATLFPVPSYGGDLWSRSFLTGDWGGLRSTLAKNGVQLEIETMHVFQDVSSGGVNQTGRYSGTADITLKLDSQKLGLWPGGFLLVHAEAAFGNPVNPFSGGILPVNTKPVMTLPARDEMVLPHVVLTQFLSEKFAVFLGKLDTTGGDANEFAHGKGDRKFMNLAFSMNPTLLRLVPYAPLGMGFVFLPNKDVILTFSAVDTEGVPNKGGFHTLFQDPTTLASELRVTVRPFGLTGHQLIGGGWSNGPFTSINQDPRTIIGSILFGTPPKKESNSWSVYYNFDQYLYTEKDDPSQGIGIFGRFGISDGKANPFHQFYSIGFGGKGIIPTRDRDHFGIGYYYLQFSDHIVAALRRRLSLDHEQGGELFYNIELLPWLHVTPDIQIIGPSRRIGTLLVPGKRIDTAVVTGFRIKIDF
jgi:porin